jgi:hypothetical protein
VFRLVLLPVLFAPGAALLWTGQANGAGVLGLTGFALLLAAIATAMTRLPWFLARPERGPA